MAARKKKPSAPASQTKLKPLPELTLSIDAAGAAGVAVFLGRKLVAYSAADGTSWTALMQVIRPMLAPYQHIPPTQRLLVIEQHWMNRMSSKGSMTLGQRRGLAQAAGEACGFLPSRIEWIASSSWQAALFKTRVPDTKAAALEFVRVTYAFTPADDNIADSIALGHYALNVRGVYE